MIDFIISLGGFVSGILVLGFAAFWLILLVLTVLDYIGRNL